MTAVAAGRSMWADKMALMLGGAAVLAFSYGRASVDKKGERYSISQQLGMNDEQITRHSWTKAGEFQDNEISASRFASKKKTRKDFAKLVEVIKSGRGHVLVLTDVSRSQRMLSVFAMLRDLCYDNGLFFWLVDGNLYDLRVTADRAALAQMALQGESQADSIHDNVKRGLKGQALDGRPHSRVPYGYERFKNQKTGAFERQVFDQVPRVAVATDGTEATYTPYGVVCEINKRLRRLEAAGAIAIDLNKRGIPSPGGREWSRQTVSFIATNPIYMGKRVHNGEIVGEGRWDAIIEPKDFYDAQVIATSSDRRTHRPFARVWEMSYVARCGDCGAWLSSKHTAKRTGKRVVYACIGRGCASVNVDKFDSYVESVMVAWLSRPDVYRKLVAQRRVNDASIAAHENEIAQAQMQLEENKTLRLAGKMHADDFVDMQKDLRDRIDAARDAIRMAAIPDIIVDLVGPDAAEQWEAIADVETRREIIKMVCAPKLHTAKKNPRMPLGERVSFGGFIGDLAA